MKPCFIQKKKLGLNDGAWMRMRQISDIKEIQRIELDIIKWFDSYAKRNSLCYYLAGGTLLGAIRHKGFIPWDDDVDIMMPRNDYQKMLSLRSDSRYKLDECSINPDYDSPFARIWDPKTYLEWNDSKGMNIGVFIDIFPIDGYPSNYFMSKLHTFFLKLLRARNNSAKRINFKEGEKFIFVKKILNHIWRESPNYYAIELNNLAKKLSFEDSDYVGVTTTSDHLFRERNKKKDIFGDKAILADFEGLKLPVPSGYDIYLKNLYGDYMKLPPKEKQISEHNFKIYMKE